MTSEHEETDMTDTTTETTMTTRKPTTFHVTIEHDPDTEDPTEYGIARLVSFSDRHINFEHPDTVLACRWEGEITEDDGATYTVTCSNGPHAPDDAGLFDGGDGYGESIPAHEYVRDPDILAILSYGEHGLCRWWVSNGGTGMFGHWDSVQVAGVLIWQGEDSEREWWASRSEEDRRTALDAVCEEYTDWANGSTFYYSIEREVDHEPCHACGHDVDEREVLDSCGGFIGSEYVVEEIAGALSYDIEREDDIEMHGEAAYIVSWTDLYRRALEIRATRESKV